MLLLSVFFTGCKQNTNPELGQFRDAPCPFDLPEGLELGENFRFGYVTVPEFHNNPNGKTIEVAVAIFPSTSNTPGPPLVLNTGGPGESNMDNFIPPLAIKHSGRLGELVLPHRDAVIIELRGLRYARPNLISDELTKARYDMMNKDLSYDEMLAIQLKALEETRDRFNKEGVNLSAFNNIETAADIAMIMTNLGYKQFSLFGSSAGTFLAQHVIRDYPDRVSCAILNAGVPIGTKISDMVPDGIRSLKRLFEKCEGDPDCSAAYPNLENRFLNFLDSINKHPITVPIDLPDSDEEQIFVLNGHRLAGMIMMYSYFSPQVPLLIDQIMSGDYAFINQFVGYQSIMSTFADILGYSIFLSEYPAFTLSDIQIDPNYLSFSKGVTAMGLGGEFLLAVDTIFNIPKIDQKRIEPQGPYDVPLLVLNGVYDPVIPEKLDTIFKNRFNNCYIYRFDGVAHSPVDFAEECAIVMFFEFLNDPSKAPESSCIDEYHLEFK
ncbi:alpha/beta fold hydrolase [Sunxiuqinia sp. sy24]|uniref:alpha/beta fold hydrolase n=1 Tax=Sunxiuqinia sp. sy24 TaxID=3461495 RepID=UPI0040459E99